MAGMPNYTMEEVFAFVEGDEDALPDDDWLEGLGLHDWTEEEIAEDRRRRLLPVVPFGFPHWTFDVLDGGEWYRIDARVPKNEFYTDVPESVQRRADDAIDAVIRAAIDAVNGRGEAPTTILGDRDHTEEYEAILRTVFDDVRFVETDYVPGIFH